MVPWVVKVMAPVIAFDAFVKVMVLSFTSVVNADVPVTVKAPAQGTPPNDLRKPTLRVIA